MIPSNRLLRPQPSHLSYMRHWSNRQNMGLIGVIDPDNQGGVWLLLHNAGWEN